MSKVILVIEDQEDNRRIMHDLLTSKGYEVIEAINGFDGVNAAEYPSSGSDPDGHPAARYRRI